MNQTLDTLKAGDSVPSDNLDHLINQMALIIRATKAQYGLSWKQMQQLFDRFAAIRNAYPEVADRIISAANNNDRFWDVPSDSVLDRLYAAGILAEGLGITE